jgi:hypothetical protein
MTHTPRSQDEIVERARAAADIFGSRKAVLVPALDYEHAREFLKAEITEKEWPPIPSRDKLLADAREYFAFALGKIRDHRGISASRSVDKLTEFAWLLGRDDVVAAMEAADYSQYGAPKVKVFADGFGLDWPESQDMTRMAAGEPCTPDCEEGCGS